MSNEIDRTEPIEAYHENGQVVLAWLSNEAPNPYGYPYRIATADGRYPHGYWFDEYGCRKNDGWRIRNRNRTEKPALTEEMVHEAYGYGRVSIDRVITLLREHGVLAEPVEDPIKAALQDKWPLLDADALRDTLAKHNLKIVEAA